MNQRHRDRTGWLLLAFLLLFVHPEKPLAAQLSKTDSAQVLLDAARLLQSSGKNDLARELLRLVQSRWPDLPAAATATGRLAAIPEESVSGLARTGFIGYHTALGAWLGVAIPAALGADGPEPYGAGLLIGAPTGFIASRHLASRYHLTEGQAGLITFASEFGIWQAVGWRAQLGIGNRTECYEIDICYEAGSDRAPYTASILGAAGGLAVGIAAGSRGVTPGTAALISHAGYWGTWLGVAGAVLLDQDDGAHGALSSALVGGDIGVLLAIPLAHQWQPSPGRVRLVSAGGLAGGLAGLGVSLLASVDDGSTTMGMVLAGNAAGMLVAAAATRNRSATAGAGSSAPALLTLQHGLRIGMPAPLPTALTIRRPGTAPTHVLGAKIPLFHAEF